MTFKLFNTKPKFLEHDSVKLTKEHLTLDGKLLRPEQKGTIVFMYKGHDCCEVEMKAGDQTYVELITFDKLVLVKRHDTPLAG